MPMSEMGQSRHFGRRSAASGLPRTTDIIRASRHVSNVPLPDSCIAASERSFDHLVGAGERCGRQLHAELSRCGLVEDQFKFGWSLHRQLGRIGAAQDSINIGCCICDNLFPFHPLRHEATDFTEKAKRVDGGKSRLRDQRSKVIGSGRRESIWQKNEPALRFVLERAN